MGDKGTLTAKEIGAVFQVLKSVLDDCKERQKEIGAGAADLDADDKDREDVEEELECEFELQQQIGECVGAVVRSSGAMCAAPFDAHLKDTCGAMLAPEARSEDHMMALCAFVDVIEHASSDPIAQAYAGHATPALLNYVHDKDVDVRQVAAYGLGIVAVAAPAHFAPRPQMRLASFRPL